MKFLVKSLVCYRLSLKKKNWSDKLITSHQPNEYSNLFYRDIVLHVQAVNSCPETAKVRRFVGVIYASVVWWLFVCFLLAGNGRVLLSLTGNLDSLHSRQAQLPYHK